MSRRFTRGLSLTGMKKPGQPIHVKDIDFLQPERAETRPPEDILKWYSPWLSLVIVIGKRLETTMSFCLSSAEEPLMAKVAGEVVGRRKERAEERSLASKALKLSTRSRVDASLCSHTRETRRRRSRLWRPLPLDP